MKNNLILVSVFFVTVCFSQTVQQDPSKRILHERSSGAQFEKVELFKIVNTKQAKALVPSELRDYTILSLDKHRQAVFRSESPTTMNLLIPNQKSTLSLDLVKQKITTDDYQIVEMPSGKIIEPDKNVVHYIGIIKGYPNSLAAISFLNGEVSGIISYEEESNNLVIGKLEDSNHQIIYKDRDISHLNNFICDSLDNPENGLIETESDDNNGDRVAVKSPRIFFDIANDIVRDKGGVQGATNYITALFNQVRILYARDNISVRLSGINAWTSNAPYGNDLNNYRNYRNNNGFNGDLGHLVTYNFSGGLAWVNALCSSYKYGVSGIHKSFNNVPTYSWSVYVVAHELGHNFGSPHTQACRWNNNNTAIDGCYNTEGGCPKPGIPSGGGTIMSYCHLTSAGINLNKGFGPQPKSLIQRTIASKGCVGSTGSDNCNWNRVGGSGLDIGAGGGKTYVAGTGSNALYERRNGSWAFVSGSSGIARVDVDGNGTPWVVRNDGKMFRYLNFRWEQIAGWASDIGVSNGSYYHVGTGNRIYKYVGNNNWSLLSGAAKRIDVDNRGLPWVIGTNDKVYRRNGNGSWSLIGNIQATDISVAEGGTQVWIIEKNSGSPYKHKGNGVWERFIVLLIKLMDLVVMRLHLSAL